MLSNTDSQHPRAKGGEGVVGCRGGGGSLQRDSAACLGRVTSGNASGPRQEHEDAFASALRLIIKTF